jgi:hypothetical protein
MTSKPGEPLPSLYAILSEVVDEEAGRGRTSMTATVETTDEGRLTVDEVLGGKK